MKAGWQDTLLALQGLAEAIHIISDNGLPLCQVVTESNFQSPPSFIWSHPFIDI